MPAHDLERFWWIEKCEAKIEAQEQTGKNAELKLENKAKKYMAIFDRNITDMLRKYDIEFEKEVARRRKNWTPVSNRKLSSLNPYCSNSETLANWTRRGALEKLNILKFVSNL